MRFSAVSLIFLLTAAISMYADDEATPSLHVRPTGRVLMDGALYASPQKHEFPDGLAIPEARLGAKMDYGKWNALIDVSYSYAKIGLRNMWVQYDFTPQTSLRFGNFIHQFGIESTSQSVKATMEQPTAATPFNPGIQLGIMATHYSRHIFAAGSVCAESNSLLQAMNAPLFIRQGYGVMTRLVYRGFPKEDSFWHVGISGAFGTPQKRVVNDADVHDGFSISAFYPTKVAQVQEVGVTVDRSMNTFKLSPEFIAAKGRVAAEGAWYFQQINRREHLHAYRAQGAFVNLRGLLIGKGYAYSSGAAEIDRPAPKSLECVVDYNYTCLSDRRAGFFGGRANTVSVTLNYYFNPYITARLNYFHAHAWDRSFAPSQTLNGFQARIMVLF